MNGFDRFIRYISGIKKVRSVKITKDDLVKGIFLGLRNTLFILVFLVLLVAAFYANPVYHFYTKPQIESYLNETSERICKYSNNDTEIVQQIIAWENSESIDLKRFDGYNVLLRYFYDARWFIYIGRANCGERAIIFEDMAKRCGLTYRHVELEGFIKSSENSIADHAWTEVWIDDGWRIADSGFRLWYPKDNQTYFTSKRNFIIGNVNVINNNTYFEDCTENYVDKTCHLKVKVMENGNFVPKSSVLVTMNYNGLKVPVIGSKSKLLTNDSGEYSVNLGVYNNTSYHIKSNYKGLLYEYYGTENITVKNGSQSVFVNITDKKLRWI